MKQSLGKTWKVWLVVLLFTSGFERAAMAASNRTDPLNVTMGADGGTLTVAMPGAGVFQSGFSARVRTGDKYETLSSHAGTVVHPAGRLAESTPYGMAEVVETTIRFEQAHVDLLFRLGRVPGVQGLLAQAGIRNAGRDRRSLIDRSGWVDRSRPRDSQRGGIRVHLLQFRHWEEGKRETGGDSRAALT